MSDNISLSGVTMGITDTNIPSVEAYGNLPYSEPALNISKDELLYNTPGNKKDHMINKIPVNNAEYLKRENSITSGVMNNQDILGFESSNRERSTRTKEQVSLEE